MSRARDLSKIGNKSTLAVDTDNIEVGIGSTVPSSTLDVRGEIKVGTAVQLGSAGVVTATSFSGSGANLTGLATTETVRTDTITVAGVSTFTGVANFSAAVNADATTDSTSVSTGALIVDGGVGIAKNVYIGAGLSVAGTLTYEDVTNVDSVGVVTAKSGVNVSGGQLIVGSGITMGIAGVATFSGTSDVHLHDGVKALFGTGSDFEIYHNGSHGFLDSNTGDLRLLGDDLKLMKSDGSSYYVDCNAGTSVDVYYNNSKKFETTNNGTVTTGIGTFTEGVALPDNKNLIFGTDSDFKIHYHSSGYTSIQNAAGAGTLYLQADGNVHITDTNNDETFAKFIDNGAVELYHNNDKKFATTNEGIEVTGFTSTTAGMGVTGGLFEGSFIKAGKLSDNATLGISTANVFYFTTQETTTATPNIVWNDSYSLSSKMAVGDVASVTVITTAAAGGYSANWTIDGNAVTEEWIGGDAPSEGGSDGLDIYSLTIIKTGTGTGDSGFKIIGNLSNAT